MQSHKAKRYTWRKGKTRDGMMRLAPHYTLHCGSDEAILRVQKHGELWYWYGLGQNTSDDMKSLDAVKAQALAYAKTHINQ